MTEDVLEQVVDDYLRRYGYFTRSNVRFGPEPGDEGYEPRLHNQPSDLDVLAVRPPARGDHRVYVISCKAMQEGFSPNKWLNAAQNGGRYRGKEAWKHMRELWDPTWMNALRRRVTELTGSHRFTYVLAVTRLDRGGNADTSVWHADETVGRNLGNTPAEVWTFADMWERLRADVTERIEPSHIGRLAQIVNASER